MADIERIKGSSGSGDAVRAVVTDVRNPGAVTLQVNSVANFPAKFIGTYGQLNVVTNKLVANSVRVFFGQLNGTAIDITAMAPGYADNGNAVGDVVLIKPTTAWADEIAALFAVGHNADGSLKNDSVDSASLKDGAVTSTKLAAGIRFTPRMYTTTSTATLTPNADNYNIYEISAQAATLAIANPSGTPNNGDALIIRIKDNGTSRAISYGTAYQNISGLDTLTATAAGKWHVLGVMYSAVVGKWQVVSISTGA